MSNLNKFKNYIQSEQLHANDFKNICNKYDGMCDHNTLSIVNYAVSNCLLEDELLLEIGAWKGRLTIASLFNNSQKAIVIDPLSCDDSNTIFYKNIKQAGIDNRVSMYKMSWQEYLHSGQVPKQNIGVLFYDGDHGNHGTFSAWVNFLPYCSDSVILFADDYCMDPVKKDIERFMKLFKYHIDFCIELPYHMKQYVVGFKKSD